MSGASAERAYSVAVEMLDGSSKTLRVQGKTPSEVYAAVRAMPGVRRVGRVVEAGKGDPQSPRPGQRSAEHVERHASHDRQSPAKAVTVAASTANGAATLGLSVDSIRGPRVVRQTRQGGGELPFKHLKAPPGLVEPPPRPKPVPKPAPVVAQAVPVAKVESPQVSAEKGSVAESEALSGENTAGGRSYRIVKSRRKDGLPYLLQRGAWRQHGDRRLFDSEWEKGFAEREKAEKHLNWLAEMEQDHAAMDGGEEAHEE